MRVMLQPMIEFAHDVIDKYQCENCPQQVAIHSTMMDSFDHSLDASSLRSVCMNCMDLQSVLLVAV
jgi:hypothetical protein